MTQAPIVWAWRVLPRWTSENDIASGWGVSEDEVKQAVQTEIDHPKAIAGMICPVTLESGEWVPVAKPSFCLRTCNGVRWLEATDNLSGNTPKIGHPTGVARRTPDHG